MADLNLNHLNHHQSARPTNGPDGPVSNSTEAVEGSSRPEDDSAKDASFGCQLCSKVFNRRENLSRHLKTHSSSPSHCCTKCGKGFTRSDLLRRHQAGHERWDNQGPKRGRPAAPVKRRRVDMQESTPSLSSSGKSSWTMSSNSSALPKSYGSAFRNVCDAFAIERPMANSSFVSAAFDNQSSHDAYQITQSPRQDEAFHQSQHGGFSNSHHEMYTPLPTTSQLPMRSLPIAPMDHFSADFSSYLLPPDATQFGQEWFSYDFYSAMRESGNEWGGLGELLDPHIPPPTQEYGSIQDSSYDQDHMPQPQANPLNSAGQISRVSSPPNEASEEDKWPFQWNPNSRQILKAHPVVIPDDHPLLQSHCSRYDITEATLMRLRYFLQPPAGREFHQSQKGTFVLPPLPVINVFILLFFEHFSPHMPVLHHPTVTTNSDLPPPLLAAIVIIGAIYSNIKHTRRFSIVLLDIVRWHLRIAMECDNNLMRDPMIIYAEALICHTGLWCGNKRAYELAEVVRGALVTYIRRVRFGEQIKTVEEEMAANGNLQLEWKQWIAQEGQRRLAWVVYAIDSYFPSILNLPPTISMGEVRNLVCPCDEEFWSATSARNWKNLLGPARTPPSRFFSAAVGPFTLPGAKIQGMLPQQGRLPSIRLNPWSAFLVLQSITHQIFHFSLESMVARTFMDDDPCDDNTMYPPHDPNNFLRKLHSDRHGQLADALDAWATAYLSRSQPHTHPASRHFHACSVVMHHLSTILLDVPLSDLQGAIGKDGMGGIVQSMANLSAWARRSPHIADQVAYNATKTIISLAPNNNINDDSIRNVDTAPYSLIAIFLCHLVIWAYATVTAKEQRMRLLDSVMQHPVLGASSFALLLKTAFGLDGRPLEEDGEPKVMFRSAAEMLTQLGTWGGSLNLALLLHRRMEM